MPPTQGKTANNNLLISTFGAGEKGLWKVKVLFFIGCGSSHYMVESTEGYVE